MNGASRRLADAAHGGGRAANNFDLLRLLGAALVLFGHSFALVGSDDPLPDALGFQTHTLGVLVFFSISGFLISASWAATPRWTTFVAKRALRLMPALVVAAVLTAYVLGPLVTSHASGDYFVNTDVWRYVVANIRLETVYPLPGVFTANAYPDAVNGSLWTLPLEAKAYVLVLALGLAGVIAGARRLLAVPLAIAVALLLVPGAIGAVPAADRFVASLAHLEFTQAEVAVARDGGFDAWIDLFAAFTIAVALFVAARHVRLSWWAAAAAVAAVATAAAMGEARWSLVLTAWSIPYVVLLVAYRTHHLVRWPARWGDYSYGLYLYAFPVQQLVVHAADPSSGLVLFALAAPLTLLCALASWHLVEQRALAHKPGRPAVA